MSREITDKDLASIYSSLSSCNPTVRGLAERLRRVEGESREMWKEIRAKEAQFRFCFNHGGSPGPAPEYCPKCLAVERERMKRMEEALKSIADYSTYDAQDLRDMAGAALKGGGE